MPPVATLILAAAITVMAAVPATLPSTHPTTAPSVTLYSPDPAHPWNRLHAALMLRNAPDGNTYGMDVLDPLLWPQTTHLLTGASHAEALAALDAFDAPRLERSLTDPLKSAVLQNDLWAIFDWSANTSYEEHRSLERERTELQARLAPAIARLALSDAGIRRLPDNYALAVAAKIYPPDFDPDHPETPFLPRDLLDDKGPWVCLGTAGEIAPVHTFAFSGRSTFAVFLNLPAGRSATMAYLDKLQLFPKPFILNPKFSPPQGDPNPVILNPDLPQFPVGTKLALLRQMMLIDDEHHPVCSPITQSLQLRVYRSIPASIERVSMNERRSLQAVFEFHTTRKRLFADPASSLKPVDPDEKDFLIFNAMPTDIFDAPYGRTYHDERHPILQSCVGCHAAPGVRSFNTFTREFSQHDNRPTGFYDTSLATPRANTARWKTTQYNWGLLEGLLRAESH